jgi:hypothetical protein
VVKSTWKISVVAVLAVSVMACGGGQSAEQAKTEQEAQQAQAGAEQMGKALESFAKGMSGGESGVKQADPVSFRDLQSVFPDQLAGWERDSPTGERMTQPVSFSEAMVTFTKGDASLVLKITDTGFSQLLLAPYAMFLTAGYEKETADGYEKSTKVGDYPAWTTWNKAGKSGELNVVVGNRFLVQIEGNGLADEKPLSQLAAATNLKKLAELH